MQYKICLGFLQVKSCGSAILMQVWIMMLGKLSCPRGLVFGAIVLGVFLVIRWINFYFYFIFFLLMNMICDMTLYSVSLINTRSAYLSARSTQITKCLEINLLMYLHYYASFLIKGNYPKKSMSFGCGR